MVQLNRTFFDYLSMAHAERVHSQVLGWLLSLEEAILPEKQKNSFLNSLFGLDEELSEIKINTEVDSIDIIIETNLGIFLIENKLKSTEHSGQTDKYAERYPDSHKYYLSLIGELPNNQEWHPITYKQLAESLSYLKIDETLSAYHYLNDYQKTVENLAFAFETFMQNVSQFPNVFSDGGLPKKSKTRIENEVQDYIRVNQLETIFQKAYFYYLTKELKEQYYISISETRGDALIQIQIGNCIYKGIRYNVGFQFQGATFKINFADNNYGQSSSKQIDELIYSSFQKVFAYTNGYGKPHKPKTKAYLSVSKKPLKNPFEMDKHELIELIKVELKNIELLKDEFFNLLAQS